MIPFLSLPLIIFILIGFFIFALWVLALSFYKIKPKIFSRFAKFTTAKELMTYNERQFFFAFRKVMPEQYLMFTKVRLADVINVNKHKGDWKNKIFWHNFRPIAMMHVDFVICRLPDSKPILVIELDDNSHYTNKQTIINDKRKNETLEKAKLQVIRTKSKTSYSREDFYGILKALQKIFAFDHF